jgi:hypothetical protein
MRSLLATTVLVLLMGLAVGLFVFWPDSYSRFRHQSKAYYAEYAQGCDSLLAQHPLGTNRFIEVPATDATLPQIIRDLRPSKIVVSTNRVWLSAGGQFGIAWEPEVEGQTNVWVLRTIIESHVRSVYVVERK